MKKTFTISLMSLLVFSSVFGVTRLTFEQHALKNDAHNDMIITEFRNPGLPGPNQLWDFSDLKIINDFNGTVQSPNYIKSAFFSNNFNTELIEFGNSFYFNISRERIEMTGYRSATGGMEIAYEKPFVKMVYPFEFGNSFTGSFNGVIKTGNAEGIVEGTYDVEADAYGKLILPGNEVIHDALRVKTVKSYTQNFSGTNNEVIITTYRWYTQQVRYPILVFITTEYKNGNQTNVSHTAAYKSAVNERIQLSSNQNANVSLYPNPFEKVFNASYELDEAGKVSIEIYDLTGKKIAELFNDSQEAGVYNQEFNVDQYSLKNGVYNFKITVNGIPQIQQLLHLK